MRYGKQILHFVQEVLRLPFSSFTIGQDDRMGHGAYVSDPPAVQFGGNSMKASKAALNSWKVTSGFVFAV